jgi:hypothetical protein
MRLHKPVALHQQPHLHQGGVVPNGQASPRSIAVAGSGYAEGGEVGGGASDFDQGKDEVVEYAKPAKETSSKSDYVPGIVGLYPATNDSQDYAKGGPVKDKHHVQQLVDHAMNAYDDFHDRMRKYHTGQMATRSYAMGGAVQPTGGGPTPTAQGIAQPAGTLPDTQASAAGAARMPSAPPLTRPGAVGYADGGMVGPGPAGPGVKPQSPQGNPGRPGWTDPNTQASGQKNFYQNVTSNPATSPSRGTSYQQPTPIGGQRGQEWYGKTRSPYGGITTAGRR